MRFTFCALIFSLSSVAYGATSIHFPNRLKNDVLSSLSSEKKCVAAFAPYSDSIKQKDMFTLSEFDLGGQLDLSANRTLNRFYGGYREVQVYLQSLTPMVPLAEVQVWRGALVFKAIRPLNGSEITFKIDDFAFEFSARGTLVSCQPRGYVVFGLENLLELRENLENSAPQSPALRDYERIRNSTESSGLGLRDFIPNRGNMGWNVMDRVYRYGLLHLLQRHSEMDDPVSEDDIYSRPARSDLIAVATRSKVSRGDFNYSDWHVNALTVAQISLGVAAGLDWFRNSLSSEDRATLKRALVNRSFKYFYGNYQKLRHETPTTFRGPFKTWWMLSGSNWNLVCHGSILVMLKVLAYEVNPVTEPELAGRMRDLFAWITKETTRDSHGVTATPLSFGLQSIINGDGGWYEGPSYWLYATLNMASMLATYSSRDLGLGSALTLEKLRTTMKFGLAMRSSTGSPFNYSDAGDTPARYASIYWLARATGNADATILEEGIGARLAEPAPHYRGFSDALALVWRKESHLRRNPSDDFLERIEHFPTTSVGRVVDKTSGSAMYLAFKGGTAQSQHRQRENGTFIFEADGVRWAFDLGSDDYSLRPPPPHMSQIYYRHRNDGNNCLSVEGELQNEFAESHTSVRDGGDVIDSSTDLLSAYQNHSGLFGFNLISYDRDLRLDVRKNKGSLLVSDKFQLRPTRQSLPIVSWNMHTIIDENTFQKKIAPDTLLLTGKNGKRLKLRAQVSNAKIVSFSLEKIPNMNSIWRTIDHSAYTQGKRPVPNGAKVVRLKVRPNNQGAMTTIQVRLTPVRED